MSTIGSGYGSEWHLLRYLGYHRTELDRAVGSAIPGGTVVEWLDSRFESDPAAIDRDPPRSLDREIEGFEFLPAADRQRFLSAWPRTGSLPCWDAVARIDVEGEACWLIVEAKSHLGELRSTCKARGKEVGGGRDRILATFQGVQAELGITVGAEAWMAPYYQFCNRVAFLQLLDRAKIPTRLLFLYFVGDRFPSARAAACPGTADGWLAALDAMDRHTGWSAANLLISRVHRLFLPVTSAAT